MKCFVLVSAVAAVAHGTALREQLLNTLSAELSAEEGAAAQASAFTGLEVDGELSAEMEGFEMGRPANHPVCNEIKNSWWKTRTKSNKRKAVNSQDELCAKFSGNVEACLEKGSSERASVASKKGITGNSVKVPCVMAGVGSKKCLGNPCNQYNNGLCTLANTGGQCVWYTGKDVKKINKFYKSTGDTRDPIRGHGCYRNPCNGAGVEKTTNEMCEARKNGVFECTYCANIGKMGCQSTSLNSKGFCADVQKSAVVSTASVYSKVGAKKCQCSTDIAFCNADVFPSAGIQSSTYTQTYKGSSGTSATFMEMGNEIYTPI